MSMLTTHGRKTYSLLSTAAAFILGSMGGGAPFGRGKRDDPSIRGGHSEHRRRSGHAARTSNPHYVSTYGCCTEAERGRVIRSIFMDGEERRKKAMRPDDRDDKYLHSHARAGRALRAAIGK